jgi:hypothetical protein
MINDDNDNYCCNEFRFAFELEQGLRYGLLGDNENHYHYKVLVQRTETITDDVEILNQELVKTRMITEVLPCILKYCNFCGTKLEK